MNVAFGGMQEKQFAMGRVLTTRHAAIARLHCSGIRSLDSSGFMHLDQKQEKPKGKKRGGPDRFPCFRLYSCNLNRHETTNGKLNYNHRLILSLIGFAGTT